MDAVKNTVHSWITRFSTARPNLRLSARALVQSVCLPAPRIRLICMLALLAGIAILIHVKSRHRVVLLDFGPTNGTFQGYNPLRRLHAGQVMFRDFYPYLGIGPTVTSYLVLRLEGNDFRSSVHSQEILAAILHVGTLIMLARLCRLSWFWSVAMAALLVFAGAKYCPTIEESYLPRTDHWAATIHGLFYMSQSAIALRAAAPILLCVYAVVRHQFGNTWEAKWSHCLADGCAAGLSLLWSNDYGLPTFAGFMTLFGLLAPGLTWSDRVKRSLRMAIVALITAGIVLTIATAGRPWGWFQYNAGVAADQFWYYEGRKVLRLSEIPRPAWVCLGLASAGLLAFDLWRRPGALGTRCLLFMLMVQLGAGYLSSIGGHIENHYFWAFQRTLTFVAPYAILRMFPAVTRTLPTLRSAIAGVIASLGRNPRTVWGGAIVQASLAFWIGREASFHYRQHLRLDRVPAHHIEVPEMGGYLGEPWSKLVQTAREIREAPLGEGEQCKLFSTYATGFETIAGEFQPTGHDYIIHALGPRERQKYLDAFRELRPRHVITLRRDLWPWERWAQSMHWDFYRELYRNYDPVDRCLFHQVWTRRSSSRDFADVPVIVHTRRLSTSEIILAVDLPADRALNAGLHYVEIELEADGQWLPHRGIAWRQRLSVVDPTKLKHSFTERFAVPLGRVWRFPVLVRPGQTTRLVLELAPQEASELQLKRLSARYVLPGSVVDDFPLTRLRAACVDSQPWQHGIQTTANGFSIVCVSDPSDLKHLRVGQRLRFARSGIRDVTKIDFNHIYLSGPPLDPDQDGYPAIIEVVP